MPRLKNSKGLNENDVVITKQWIEIPIKPHKDSTPKVTETYLVSKRVAEYIELLEDKITGRLLSKDDKKIPKLNPPKEEKDIFKIENGKDDNIDEDVDDDIVAIIRQLIPDRTSGPEHKTKQNIGNNNKKTTAKNKKNMTNSYR